CSSPNQLPRLFESASLLPRPLRSAGVTPLHRYYEPLRLPCPQLGSLSFRCLSCCVAATGGKALPACPTQLSLRLSPFTPENSGIARKHLFTPDVWLQPFWKS